MEIQRGTFTSFNRHHFLQIPNSTHHPILVSPHRKWLKLSCSASPPPDPVVDDDGHDPPILQSILKSHNTRKKRVFFLDVNPLCYKGSSPCLLSFAHWISLFFSQVSLTHPVIAVVDGERGNEYRRQLLPSYKANRRKSTFKSTATSTIEFSHRHVLGLLHRCNVPVVKIESHEADDVIATLVEQTLELGHRAVIASPDKDFKQLLSERVQIVIPMPEFDRWSFYTLKHYVAQNQCYPGSDLSLRCILGDEVDGVPGIQHLVPGFGRKTALKLLKKHGTLENLLQAAAVRTVGKQYAQDALVKHADYLRRNYQVLSLKTDVNVHIEEQWLEERDARNDSLVISNFVYLLKENQKRNLRRSSYWETKHSALESLNSE